jgi:hypothetical protein
MPPASENASTEPNRVKAFAKFFKNYVSVSSMSRIIFGICGLLIASSAHADTVVFDSFGPGNTYEISSFFYVGKAGSSPTEQAAQFTAQASGFLSTVELGLTRPSGHPSTAVNVFLYGDLNGSPDNSNQIFLGSADPAGTANQTNNSVATVDVLSQVFVSLDSIYWLVLKPATPDGLTFWNFSNTTLGQMRVSGDDSTWETEGDPRIAAFRINAVPEPNSTVLLSIGLAVSLLLMSRRNDRNSET